MRKGSFAKWTGLGVLTVIVAIGGTFLVRPLAMFRIYNATQMFFLGAKSSFTNVGGYRVHYYTMGPADGPAAVLIHGLGGRSDDWEKLAPYLAKAGYRVYLPDLPGYGESEKPASFSYSVTDESKIVVGFLDRLGLQQVDLGGWSMGGWIVQLVAANHPERVRRLMLFDSAGLYMKPQWDTRLFTPISAAELDRFVALLMPNPPQIPDFVARDILRTSRDHAWIIHRALGSMLQGRETTDQLLPRLGMPVLIVWGASDMITPLSEGQKMQKLIPHAQLEVVQGCGHLAPNDCARQIGPQVVGFLKNPA